VVETREPGGSPGAEAIRALLLEGRGRSLDAGHRGAAVRGGQGRSCRAHHPARARRRALGDLGRYLDSSLAYQGGAHAVGEAAIMALHAIGSGGLLPDRTIL
jgi:dTMP kinase